MVSKNSFIHTPTNTLQLRDLLFYRGKVYSLDSDLTNLTSNTTSRLDPCCRGTTEDCIINVEQSQEKITLFRVVLANKCFVICSPEASIMKANGTFIKVKDLQGGEELMCIDLNNNRVLESKEYIEDFPWKVQTQTYGNFFVNNLVIKSD